MYRREKPIALKGSASSLCNNLSILVMPDKRQISYAVVHKYAVNVVAAATDGSSVTARQVICKEPSATQGNPFLMEACTVSFLFSFYCTATHVNTASSHSYHEQTKTGISNKTDSYILHIGNSTHDLCSSGPVFCLFSL